MLAVIHQTVSRITHPEHTGPDRDGLDRIAAARHLLDSLEAPPGIHHDVHHPHPGYGDPAMGDRHLGVLPARLARGTGDSLRP